MLHEFQILGKNMTIFLAVLADVQFLEVSPSFLYSVYSITFLVMIVEIISIILFIPFIWMIANSSIFHYNLIRIFLFISVNMFFLEISVFFLIFYQLGYLRIHVSIFSDFFGVFLSLYSFFVVFIEALIVQEITLERIFATYFIADYEQRKRPQISFLILLIVIILNISAAIFTLFAFAFDIVTTICIASPAYIVMALITIYGYKKLHDYNEKLRTHLSKDHCGIEYNLSLRFQVDENLRALKLLHTLLITLSFLNCLGAIFGVITFAIFDQTSIPAQILGSLFELWIVLYTLFFLFTVLYSVDEWRHHYVDIWRNIFGLQPIEIRPEKRSRDSETTLYFDYYKQNW